MTPDDLYCEKTPRLTETLCWMPMESDWCQIRFGITNHDHAHDTPIIVAKEVQKLDRVCVEKELKNIHSLPTSGTLQGIKERLARAWLKKWLPPKSPKVPQGSNCNNTELTENFMLISSVINTITDRNCHPFLKTRNTWQGSRLVIRPPYLFKAEIMVSGDAWFKFTAKFSIFIY